MRVESKVIGPSKNPLRTEFSNQCAGDEDKIYTPTESPENTIQTKKDSQFIVDKIDENNEENRITLKAISGFYDSLDNEIPNEQIEEQIAENSQPTQFCSILDHAIAHFSSPLPQIALNNRTELESLKKDHTLLVRKYTELEKSHINLQNDYNDLHSCFDNVQQVFFIYNNNILSNKKENEKYKAIIKELKKQLLVSQKCEQRIIDLYKQEILEKESSNLAFNKILTKFSSPRNTVNIPNAKNLNFAFATIEKAKKMEEEIMKKDFELQMLKAELNKETHASNISTNDDFNSNSSIMKSVSGKLEPPVSVSRLTCSNNFACAPKGKFRTRHDSMASINPSFLHSIRQSP